MDMNNRVTDKIASALLSATFTVAMLMFLLLWVQSDDEESDDSFTVDITVSCKEVLLNHDSFGTEAVETCRDKLKLMALPAQKQSV